jgi:hypothetical protein
MSVPPQFSIDPVTNPTMDPKPTDNTNITEPLNPSTDNGTSNDYQTTSISENTTTTPITTTTPEPASTLCPPGHFPFGSGCISASENGGVVITAFILSILSFIGVVVSEHRPCQSKHPSICIRARHRTFSSSVNISHEEEALCSAMRLTRCRLEIDIHLSLEFFSILFNF